MGIITAVYILDSLLDLLLDFYEQCLQSNITFCRVVFILCNPQEKDEAETRGRVRAGLQPFLCNAHNLAYYTAFNFPKP